MYADKENVELVKGLEQLKGKVNRILSMLVGKRWRVNGERT